MNDNKLGDDSDSLEVDWEGPQHFGWGEVLVDKQGEDSAGHKDVGEEETVVLLVVGVAVGRLELHKVDDKDWGTDKNHLHHAVVDRHKVVEEVQVACDEDERVEELRFEGHTWLKWIGIWVRGVGRKSRARGDSAREIQSKTKRARERQSTRNAEREKWKTWRNKSERQKRSAKKRNKLKQ